MKVKNKLYFEYLTATQNGDLEKIQRLIREEKLPLLFACSAGNIEMVEFMIKHGADVSYINENGRNALSIAYKKKHKSICDILISNGANFKCQDGFKLLMENCKSEEMGDLEFLLSNGAPQDGYEPYGMCPLMVASKNGFIHKVRFLLKNSLEFLNGKNKNGLSPLHFACINHHLEVARLLIEKGADVNTQDFYQETPLMVACKMNHRAIIELLLENEADVNRTNRIGETPLILSLKYADSNYISNLKRIEYLEMARYLIENGADLNLVDKDGNSALIIAIKSHNSIRESEKIIDLLVRIIKTMIEKNVDLDCQNNNGETALMIASSRWRDWYNQIFKLMFEKNVNVNLQNSDGNTALMLAFDSRRFDKAKLLIEHGVNLNLVNNKGNTALMVAVENFCDLPIVKMMIEMGANINLQNSDGNTALMVLVERDSYQVQLETVKFLIECGTDLKLVNKYKQNALFLALQNGQRKLFDLILDTNIINLNDQDYRGNTILHYSCLYKIKEPYVELLMNEGVELNIKNEKGNTPLMLAVENHCESSTVKKMIEKGADVNLQNNEGKTPLICSLQKRNLKLSEMLIEKGANLHLRDKDGKTALYYAFAYKLNEVAIHLIEKGAHLHYKCQGKRIIDELDEKSSCNRALLMYRNALIKELSNAFNYTYYECFKKRVIESIQNEEVIVVEYDHLKGVIHLFSYENHRFEEEKAQFKSLEFRERLIVDYLNVLNDQKELLEITKLKLCANFLDLHESSQQNIFSKNDSKEEFSQNILRSLFLEEAVDILKDSIDSQDSFDQKIKQFKVVIETVNKCTEIIKEKIRIALQFLELVESKSKLI